MLQNILGFFAIIGVSPIKGSLIIVMAAIAAGMYEKKLEYKIEESKKEDGNREYKVYKYK